MFQCSSASRKFLNRRSASSLLVWVSVSVLFSEPKIPQSSQSTAHLLTQRRFSALQRAENSSMPEAGERRDCCVAFQCSSASRKFLNCANIRTILNAIIQFQCSSASRKFLNYERNRFAERRSESFSALQRAENSSMNRSRSPS